MINSKAIKEFTEDVKTDGLIYWLKDKFVWRITDFINRIYERSIRSLAYANFGWKHYDFDSAYMWDLLSFKLKRIEKALKEGNAIQEDADMVELAEAITICDRIFTDEYENKYHDLHDIKWGELPPWKTEKETRVINGKNMTMYRVISQERPKVITETDKVLERREFSQCWEKGALDRATDIDRLCLIFKNTSQKWWD